ncbi:MAG: hypothetical protein K2P81_02625 [Bacteriovoracaceae bacterium]|nr:hypothetical protein [Bacteriovoracaceae bacterium]
MKFLLIALILAVSPRGYAGLCENRRAPTIAEQLANLELKTELDLINLDLFEGGSIVSGYQYEVEPAYNNGLYARTDSWKIGVSAIPSTASHLAEDLTATFGLGAKFSAEASFIRFFNDPCKAETVKPYTPKRIPLKASTAIGSKFKIGDYFIFKSRLGFVVSLDILKLLGDPLWNMGVDASYLIEGNYQVHIVRIDESHVRLKIVARRGKDGALGLGVGWGGEFDVFGISLLDRQVKRQVNPKPLKVSYHDTNAQVFLIDYILDLSDSEVASAYDLLLKKAQAFENLKLAAPFRDESTLEGELILDLESIESIYRRDFQNNNVKRVKRNLRSSSRQDGRSFGLNLGNKILGLEYDATASASRVTLRKPDDSLERFLLKSYDRTYDGHFLWSFTRLFSKRSVEVLLKSEEGFEKLEALNIVQTFEMKDKSLDRREFDDLKVAIKKALPTSIYQEIDFSTWKQEKREKVKNFGYRFQLVMGPEVIFNTPHMNRSEIIDLYRDYIMSKNFSSDDFYKTSNSEDQLNRSQDRFTSALYHIASKLSIASDRSVSDVARLEAFMDLRNNTLFSQTGIGFLMTLNPEQTFRFDLNLSGNNNRLDFSKGDESVASFYRQILTIKAALDDEGLNLRREAESIGHH